MGDGLIGLILSTDGVASHFNIATTAVSKEQKVINKQEQSKVTNEVVVFELDGSAGLYCFDQKKVARFEQWRKSEIQLCGKQMMTPYRGKILNLFHLKHLLHFADDTTLNSTPDELLCIIVEQSERNYGFIVKSIREIRTVTTEIIDVTKNLTGISGALIFDDQIVSVVDIPELFKVSGL
jgi:chemotaxis protein histidine kinase CheA